MVGNKVAGKYVLTSMLMLLSLINITPSVVMSVEMEKMCHDLQYKIGKLLEELQLVAPQEAEQIEKELEILKAEYERLCVDKAEMALLPLTPPPLTSCEELIALSQALAMVEQKAEEARKAFLEGKLDGGELLAYESELSMLKREMEKASRLCEEGKVSAENACIRLGVAERVHSILLEAVEVEKVAEMVEKLSGEVARLKAMCREIEVKDVMQIPFTDVADVQQMVKKKMEVEVEEGLIKGKSKEELLSVYEQLERVKRQLILQLASEEGELRMDRHVMRWISVGERVVGDGVVLPVQKVSLEVEGKWVELVPGEELNVSLGGLFATGKIELVYANGTLRGKESGKEIRFFPAQIGNVVREKIVRIQIEDDSETETVKYKVESERAGRLFWIFPTKERIYYEIDATTGKILRTARPFWHFLIAPEKATGRLELTNCHDGSPVSGEVRIETEDEVIRGVTDSRGLFTFHFSGKVITSIWAESLGYHVTRLVGEIPSQNLYLCMIPSQLAEEVVISRRFVNWLLDVMDRRYDYRYHVRIARLKSAMARQDHSAFDAEGRMLIIDLMSREGMLSTPRSCPEGTCECGSSHCCLACYYYDGNCLGTLCGGCWGISGGTCVGWGKAVGIGGCAMIMPTRIRIR